MLKPGKYYWLFFNEQPIKAKLVNIRLNTTNVDKGKVLPKSIEYPLYSFKEIYDRIDGNKSYPAHFKEEKVFKTLISLAKHHKLV